MARSSAARGFTGISSRFDSDGRGQSFLVIGIEGIVLTVIALYMVISPDSARDNIRLIAGLVFLAAGLYQLQRAFTYYHASTHRSVVPIRFIGGSFMLFGGLLIVLEKLTGHFNIEAARIVLASTLIAAGVFGIVAGLLGRRDGDLKLANIVASVILLILAGFNISEVRSGDDKTRTIGVIVLLLGLALIAYAYLIRQRAMNTSTIIVTPPSAPVYTARAGTSDAPGLADDASASREPAYDAYETSPGAAPFQGEARGEFDAEPRPATGESTEP